MFRFRDAMPLWAFSLLAATLGARVAQAAPVEQRCTDLGATCICSEPMRFTAAAVFHEGVDPADSEGAGAKECNGGQAIDAEPTGMTLVSSVDGGNGGLDFPGPNPPAFVLRMGPASSNDGDNGWQVNGTPQSGLRNETVCTRGYQRFSSDLPINRDPMRIKLAEELFSTGLLIQHSIDINGSGHNDTWSGDCTGTINFQLQGRTAWLRQEACLDIGTTSVSSRNRMTNIETGQTETIRCGPYTLSTPATLSSPMIGNLFIQTLGTTVPGYRYFTTAIETRGPLDTTFWPGAAVELEGTGGPTSPPPTTPPPTTPPPTESLGKPGQPQYTP